MRKTIATILAAGALTAFLAACDEKKDAAPRAPSEEPARNAVSIRDVSLDDVKESAKAAVKEAVKGLPYAEEVGRVMAKIGEIPASASEITGGKAGLEKAQSVLESLKEIPVADTPEDFQAAYAELVKSYDEVCGLAKKLPTKESLSDGKALASSLLSSLKSESSDGNARNVMEEVKSAFANLEASRAKLAEIAKKYVK